MLAYQSEKLQDYLVLTERRALNTYNWIKRSNLFLIAWGSVFLIATLVFAIWAAIDPGQVSWEIVAVTGGVGLIQLVTAFYTQPMKDLQKNLMNLTTYRMVLESHSLKMALARFHLTTPRTLRDVRSEGEATEAKLQVEVLEKELAAMEKADAVDYTALERLRIGPDEDARGDSKHAAEKESPARTGDGEGSGPGTDGQPKPPPVAATADGPESAGSSGTPS